MTSRIDALLDQLEAAHEAATPGSWEQNEGEALMSEPREDFSDPANGWRCWICGAGRTPPVGVSVMDDSIAHQDRCHRPATDRAIATIRGES